MNTPSIAGYSEKQIRAAITVCEALSEFLDEKSKEPDLLTTLLMKYGECVSKAKAAFILSRSAASVTDMLKDGRLEWAGKKMVSVRSIAEYMKAPRDNDLKARITRRNGGKPPRWHVV